MNRNSSTVDNELRVDNAREKKKSERIPRRDSKAETERDEVKGVLSDV